jgi:hypothetical protein
MHRKTAPGNKSPHSILNEGDDDANTNASSNSSAAIQSIPDGNPTLADLIAEMKAMRVENKTNLEKMQQEKDELQLEIQSMKSTHIKNNSSIAVHNGNSVPNPIESTRNFDLPPVKDFKLMGEDEPSVTPEKFLVWHKSIVSALNARKVYKKLLSPPSESWTGFKTDNPKYTADQLEPFYLDANRKLWDFLTGCINSAIKSEIEEEFQSVAPIRNLSIGLAFTEIDETFFEDCYALMEVLMKRYQRKNHWSLSSLMDQLSALTLIFILISIKTC